MTSTCTYLFLPLSTDLKDHLLTRHIFTGYSRLLAVKCFGMFLAVERIKKCDLPFKVEKIMDFKHGFNLHLVWKSAMPLKIELLNRKQITFSIT